LKKKRCKPKVYVIYSTKYSRKFPSRECDACPGAGSLQDTKQTWPKKTSPWHIIIIISSNTENRERILKADMRFLNRNLKSKKGMEWGILSTERKQFQS
jgi:hypothetical protein